MFIKEMSMVICALNSLLPASRFIFTPFIFLACMLHSISAIRQVQSYNFEQLIIAKLCVAPKINNTISFATHHIWTWATRQGYSATVTNAEWRSVYHFLLLLPHQVTFLISFLFKFSEITESVQSREQNVLINPLDWFRLDWWKPMTLWNEIFCDGQTKLHTVYVCCVV